MCLKSAKLAAICLLSIQISNWQMSAKFIFLMPINQNSSILANRKQETGTQMSVRFKRSLGHNSRIGNLQTAARCQFANSRIGYWKLEAKCQFDLKGLNYD